MQSEGHLSVQRFDLQPSAEWNLTPNGWCIIRMSQGVAYCFSPGESRELAVGDMLAVPPGGAVLFRASQLGPSQLHYFYFRPESLNCLLTLPERHGLDAMAGTSVREVRHLPAGHPVAEQFAALCATTAQNKPLLERCQALLLAAALFAPYLATAMKSNISLATAPERFMEMMQKMPEIEILNYSPAELARRCGCSLRHFSRLFHAHFGGSIRAKQTGLRLEKAQRLLRETDAKIINVALDSGYHHLGLFNATFKRHFGVTPTEFRNSAGRRPRVARAVSRLAVLLAGFFCWFACMNGARAAETNAPAATNAPGFEVRGYAVEGNTLLTPSVLHEILDKHTGPSVTFDNIREGLAEMQMAFRQRGYVTVSVGLPQQRLTNGIVKIHVTEGRLAEITLAHNHFFSSNNIMAALPSLQSNTLLNNLVLQQELDHANQNRDRQIYPEITPGPEPGTSSLRLNIKDRLPLHARLETDNYSTPGTPEFRVNNSIQYNNLWQLDHQIGVQYSFSPDSYKSGNESFYDLPSIANYSAFYRLPIASLSEEMPERSVDVGDFGYDEVSKRFRPPPLSGNPEMVVYASRSDSDTGLNLVSDSVITTSVSNSSFRVEKELFQQTISVNEDIGFRVSAPLPDFDDVSSTFSAGLDHKGFRSRSLQLNVLLASINGELAENLPTTNRTANAVTYVPFAVGWSGARPDKWGSTSFNVNSSFNFAGLARNQNDFRTVASSSHADGNYFIGTAGVSREQKLFDDISLRVSADGQWANQPLINNEQFGIGGNAGVRGYRDGQEYGDTGWRVLVEPHTQLSNIGMLAGNVPVYARFSLFTDYGAVYHIDPTVGTPGSIPLWGAGFSFSGTMGQHADFRLTFGMPLLAAPGVRAYDRRISFFFAMQF